MELRAREAERDDFPHLLRLAYGDPCAAMAATVRVEWDWLWSTGRFLATTVLDVESRRPVALMGAILIAEEYFQSLATNDEPYCNRCLARESLLDDGPLPPPERLTDGSATLLINYFAWDAEIFTTSETAVLRGYLADAFLHLHGGYAFRRIALEVIGADMLALVSRTGAQLVNGHARWAKENAVPPREGPYLVAVERDYALTLENHWYARAFRYQPPRLGFTAGQREMLRLARQGLTDRQIADRLCLNPETLKKRWESVYERFYERLPGVLEVATSGKRGTEKRRLVLAHLHERMEELRP